MFGFVVRRDCLLALVSMLFWTLSDCPRFMQQLVKGQVWAENGPSNHDLYRMEQHFAFIYYRPVMNSARVSKISNNRQQTSAYKEQTNDYFRIWRTKSSWAFCFRFRLPLLLLFQPFSMFSWRICEWNLVKSHIRKCFSRKKSSQPIIITITTTPFASTTAIRIENLGKGRFNTFNNRT